MKHTEENITLIFSVFRPLCVFSFTPTHPTPLIPRPLAHSLDHDQCCRHLVDEVNLLRRVLRLAISLSWELSWAVSFSTSCDSALTAAARGSLSSDLRPRLRPPTSLAVTWPRSRRRQKMVDRFLSSVDIMMSWDWRQNHCFAVILCWIRT